MLRTSSGDKASAIRSEATRQKSEVDSVATAQIAPIANETARTMAVHIQRGIEIDRDESRQLSALERERSQANNQAREKKLEIDQWQTDELAKVERDSSTRAQ
ncbi:MAG: hypothetical protein EA401_08275 [Planctomycetota bacterium]|nr:MAG: hypothetical protein EA401_08275 [Planctomycetota bacterium]